MRRGYANSHKLLEQGWKSIPKTDIDVKVNREDDSDGLHFERTRNLLA
jgi:hypothetical protein